MAENGIFGHVGQSEVSENGPNEFAMPQNPRIYTKILFLACSELKLQVWPCYGHFGHLGHSEVSENGHKEFPMPQYLGIDTKIPFLAGSDPK